MNDDAIVVYRGRQMTALAARVLDNEHTREVRMGTTAYRIRSRATGRGKGWRPQSFVVASEALRMVSLFRAANPQLLPRSSGEFKKVVEPVRQTMTRHGLIAKINAMEKEYPWLKQRRA